MNILAYIKQALKRRKTLQKEIDSIDRMFAQFGSVEASNAKPALGKRKRRTMSAAAKARMSAAAKLRWKKAKAAGKSRL